MKHIVTTIIRQRGQLTIPELIRAQCAWAKPDNVVSIHTINNDKIIIEPYHKRKKIDWKKLRQQIELVRSFKGKRGNLSKFIIEDRLKH